MPVMIICVLIFIISGHMIFVRFLKSKNDSLLILYLEYGFGIEMKG